MAKCDLCGKSPQFGHNVSHSKRRTNRLWAPNIQNVTVEIDGVLRRLRLCTRCLRTVTKSSR
ncbi:MAG: 50S ribosomal protein L28 [Chloroflexi bacterium]|nr:50S ribosomal protein L28 [Chloroflexota bacterium]